MADLTIPTGNGSMGTIQLGTSTSVTVKTQSGSMTFTFTSGGSCFTDGETSFTIDTSGVSKTTLALASSGHNFSAGGQTGDINIGDDR